MTMARQVAAALVIGTAMLVSGAAAQSSGTAAPRGLDFRLPPADDDRDSKVQGPSDNGLPPRQESPRPVPKAAPKAEPVQPPRIAAPTTAAPKAVTPSPKAVTPAPKAATPAPKAAPKIAPAVPKMSAPVAPPTVAPTVTTPALPPQTEPAPQSSADGLTESEAITTTAPMDAASSVDDSAFLPAESVAENVSQQTDEASSGDSDSPWWAWPLAGLVALIAAVLYWRRQTALGPEDYLEIAQSQAQRLVPPAGKPQGQGTAPAPAQGQMPPPVPRPAAPRPAAQPQPASPVRSAPPLASDAMTNHAPVGGPLGASGASGPLPRPAPLTAPAAAPQARVQSPARPAPAPVPAPRPAAQPAPAPAGVVPAWTNLDEYVSAGSMVRRPSEEARANVDMDVTVRSIRIEVDHIAVGFTLTLNNGGARDATGLMVRIALGQGSAMHEGVLGRFYDGAGGSILRDDMALAAGRSEQLSSEVKLPRTAIEPMILAGKPLLVPVLAADVTYHWDGDSDAFGQIAAAYVLGRAAVGGTEKLAPIPLDRAPLAVDRPSARATEVTRRQ